MIKNSVIIVIAIIFSILSLLVTVGAITKSKIPQVAITLQPINGYSLEKMAANAIKKQLVVNQGKFPENIDPAISNMAIGAFALEPISPEAIGVIALTKKAALRSKLMGMAFALSRREQLNTGWLISESGEQGNIPAMLNYYDTVLRTNASASPIIIPVLINALSDQSAVEPFTNLLKKKPPWADSFWRQIVATSSSIGYANEVRLRMDRSSDDTRVELDGKLLGALIREKRFDEVESLYRFFVRSGEKLTLLGDGGLKEVIRYPPVDWEIFSTGEYGAAIDGGKLHLSAISNSGGLFARQLIKLPLSTSQIKIESASPVSKTANIYLQLDCAEDIINKPIPIKISISSELVDKNIRNQNGVCSFFWMSLFGRVSENNDGVDFIINNIVSNSVE